MRRSRPLVRRNGGLSDEQIPFRHHCRRVAEHDGAVGSGAESWWTGAARRWRRSGEPAATGPVSSGLVKQQVGDGLGLHSERTSSIGRWWSCSRWRRCRWRRSSIDGGSEVRAVHEANRRSGGRAGWWSRRNGWCGGYAVSARRRREDHLPASEPSGGNHRHASGRVGFGGEWCGGSIGHRGAHAEGRVGEDDLCNVLVAT